MEKPLFRLPPVGLAIFGHYVLMLMVGNALSRQASLQILHDLLMPFVHWVPNVSSLARLTPDPIFTETFLAISLLLGQGIVVYFFVFLRGKYCTVIYKNYSDKFLHVILVALFMGLFVFVLWILPYAETSHVGRAAFFLSISSSTKYGVMFLMNGLLISSSLGYVLIIWGQLFCTRVSRRSWM
ncbi:MAG: hypothetical protein JNK17_03740 [Hydrogenophaga sp.]|nr:hypothetical protein [Hydrogenophaga sp.]